MAIFGSVTVFIFLLVSLSTLVFLGPVKKIKIKKSCHVFFSGLKNFLVLIK